MKLMSPHPQTTVVDVGVADEAYGTLAGHAATYNFFEAMYPWPERITAVGTTPLRTFRSAFPHVRAVTADGTSLPFDDGSFDIGFSNAVIEHLSDREAQRRFVSELCRVSRRIFLTTPNRWFPIELHTLVPLAHWLPPRQRHPLFQLLRKGDERELRLLGPRELAALFPRPPRIINLGMTLVAVTPPASPYTGART